MPDAPPTCRERLAAAADLPWARALAAGATVAGLVVAAAVAAVAVRGAPAPVEERLPRATATAPAGAVVGSAAGAGGRPAVPSASEGDRGLAPEPDAYVHAAGAVARPGLYRVRPGSRVADLLDAAGGPTPDADVDQLNLAAKVGDGERVHVPRRGEAPAAGAGPGAVGSASAPVDLNTATVEQLDSLPGVGPATAQAIVDHRTEHGRFARVDELLEVRGIGEAKLAGLRSRVRV